ncbi:hypothetical protein [Deinococcus sp.]|uniref:hypothetical protein n=1 Tax=Deinococcus sp. TaxID=47478 RepID=UPI003CC5326D
MQYSKYELITAYIRVTQGLIRPNDAKNYLNALERAFGATISREGIQSAALEPLWYRFEASVAVDIKTVSTWEGVLEDSITPRLLDRMGTIGDRLRQMDKQVNSLLKEAKQSNMRLMEYYFDLLWPDIPKHVSSEQLKEADFDDTGLLGDPDYWEPYF